jgi:hypothetical protein
MFFQLSTSFHYSLLSKEGKWIKQQWFDFPMNKKLISQSKFDLQGQDNETFYCIGSREKNRAKEKTEKVTMES